MNLLLLLLVIGLAASDKLDRTYLPPPGSKFSGGSPGDIQVPFEYPKESYSTTARPVQIGSNDLPTLGDSKIELGISRGLGQPIEHSRNFGSTPKTPVSDFQTSPRVPITTTSYAFTQTTTIPPFDDYETTTGSFSSVIPGFPTTGSLAELQYQQPQTSQRPNTGQKVFDPKFTRPYNGSQNFNQQLENIHPGQAIGDQVSNINAQIPIEGQVFSNYEYPETNVQELSKYKKQRPGVTGDFIRYPESQHADVQPGSPIDKKKDFRKQYPSQNVEPTFFPSITQPQSGFQKVQYEGDQDNIHGIIASKPRVPPISYLPGQDASPQQEYTQSDINKPSYKLNQYQDKGGKIPIQQYPSLTGNQFGPSRGIISENIQSPGTTVTPSTLTPEISFQPGKTSSTFPPSSRSEIYAATNVPTFEPSTSEISYPYASTKDPIKQPSISSTYPSISRVTNKQSDTAGYPGISGDGSPSQTVRYTNTQQPALFNQPTFFKGNQTRLHSDYNKIQVPGTSNVNANHPESFFDNPTSDFPKRRPLSEVHPSYAPSNLNLPSVSEGYPNTHLPVSSNQSGSGVRPTTTVPGFPRQPSSKHSSILASNQFVSDYPSTPAPSFESQSSIYGSSSKPNLPYQPYNQGAHSSTSDPGSQFKAKVFPISPVSGSLSQLPISGGSPITSTLKSTNIPYSQTQPTSSSKGILTGTTVVPSSSLQYQPISGDHFSTASPSGIDQSDVPGDYRIPSKEKSGSNGYLLDPQQRTLPQKLSSAISKRPERPQSEDDRNAVIINYENIINPDGFSYSYDTSNGIHADEIGTATDGVKAKGGYSYTGDDGKVYTVTYSADENGFRPQGDHLPTPPPIPDAILKVIEQNAKDKELGVVDDGLYDDAKYGHKKYQSLKNYEPAQYDSPASQISETPDRGLSRDDKNKYGTHIEGKPVSSSEEDETYINEEVEYADREKNKDSRPIKYSSSRLPYSKESGQNILTDGDRRVSGYRNKAGILGREESDIFDKPKQKSTSYPDSSTVNKYLPGHSKGVADKEKTEDDKDIESPTNAAEDLDNGSSRPIYPNRPYIESKNKDGNVSHNIRRPGDSARGQDRLIQRRPSSKKPLHEATPKNIIQQSGFVKQPSLSAREQYRSKPKPTTFDQSGKEYLQIPNDDLEERYVMSNDGRVKTPYFEQTRLLRPQSSTSYRPITDGIENDKIPEQGYEYNPPQRKFLMETTIHPSHSSAIKEVVPTNRPSQTVTSYDRTNEQGENGKPFKTPDVSREDDVDKYEYDTHIPSIDSHKHSKVIPVDESQHDRNEQEYYKEKTSDQDIDDKEVKPTRIPTPTSSRIGTSRRPTYETDEDIEYGKPTILPKKLRPGQKGYHQYPNVNDTNRYIYSPSSTTPVPSRGSTRYGSTHSPQESSRYYTSSKPLETSETPDYSEEFVTGKATDATKYGKPSQRPMSIHLSEEATYQDHTPSTTYRPNYTIVHKPRPGAPSVVSEDHGRPVVIEQLGTFPKQAGSPSYTNKSRTHQPSRDDLSQGKTYQLGYGPPVNNDSRVPSRGRPEFEPSYPFDNIKGQPDERFEESIEEGHGPPSYPSSYNKVKGEDFSGPKQPQRFDPKTGYHYK